MLAERSHTTEETILGPFEVAADRASVARFAQETGARDGGVPATFPIVWLSGAELKAALRAAAGPDCLPVHESQAFDYIRPLTPGDAYRLTALARRVAAPDRLIVEASVSDRGGALALTMRAVLRIVPLAGGSVR